MGSTSPQGVKDGGQVASCRPLLPPPLFCSAGPPGIGALAALGFRGPTHLDLRRLAVSGGNVAHSEPRDPKLSRKPPENPGEMAGFRKERLKRRGGSTPRMSWGLILLSGVKRANTHGPEEGSPQQVALLEMPIANLCLDVQATSHR